MAFKSNNTVGERFFEPLKNIFHQNKSVRACPKVSDWQWVQSGLFRVLGPYRSGRDFLQSLAGLSPQDPVIGRSNFFASLKSARRLKMVKSLSESWGRVVNEKGEDVLADHQALDEYEIFAGDGHYLAHATHDQKPADTSKRAIGHFFSLNLRSHSLGYLSLHDSKNRKREHDIRMLKRLEIEQLRQGTPKGKKVIWVWDRAGIDFLAWYKWKNNHGIYFISREKENMKLLRSGNLKYDQNDPLNLGVTRDEQVGTSNGIMIRRISFTNHSDGSNYVYITSEMTLAPGLIVLLYKMRWDIEKVFDETKTKLGEKKAWATSDEAKEMHAHFLCIAHNAMLLYEQQIKREYSIENSAENKRRRKRYLEKLQIFKDKGFSHIGIYELSTYATQRSLKFIRWLRYTLLSHTSEKVALSRLHTLYQSL